MIYLDNAATTAVDPEVADAMADLAKRSFGYANPSSPHRAGRRLAAEIDAARESVGSSLGTEPENLIFTSGATEANNLALLGAARAAPRQRRRLVSVATEHDAVLAPLRQLEREGFELTLLQPDRVGRVSEAAFREALGEDVALASVMWLNNEIGVRQDIAALGKLCQHGNVLFHVDAAQGMTCGLPDLAALPVDLMSFSGHKMHGPKGVGVLYRRPGVRVLATHYGGGQESGLRPGTLAGPLIVGIARAFALAAGAPAATRISRQTEQLWSRFAELPDVWRNGPPASPILSVTFAGVLGETLLAALPELAVSPGSACGSEDPSGSHVLKALGLDPRAAKSTLRFSPSRFTTDEEIETAGDWVGQAVREFRRRAAGRPAWCDGRILQGFTV